MQYAPTVSTVAQGMHISSTHPCPSHSPDWPSSPQIPHTTHPFSPPVPQPPSTTHHQPPTINHPPSTNHHQPTTLNHQLSTPTTIAHAYRGAVDPAGGGRGVCPGLRVCLLGTVGAAAPHCTIGCQYCVLYCTILHVAVITWYLAFWSCTLAQVVTQLVHGFGV